MLREITADLHLHTCLSPCASLDMTPKKIAAEAARKGLALIAVTDHNSAENTGAVQKAAEGSGLVVIPGMEINTAEEVHLVALFESVKNAHEMQELVFANLMAGENDENLFGMQVIATAEDEVDGFNKRLLIGATSLTVNAAVEAVHSLGGLAVAAHIDREMNSILSQLGFIPPDLPLDGVEVSSRIDVTAARKRFAEYERFPFLTSSDSHELHMIGSVSTRLLVEVPSFRELALTLRGTDGRTVVY